MSSPLNDGSASSPSPSSGSAPVEKKVTAATLAAFGVSVLIAILNGAIGNAELLGGLPPVVQALLIALVPPLVTFLAGYSAPHTSRSHNLR